MSSESKLFRDEAYQGQRVKWLGEIVISNPISFTFLTIAATLMAVCVIVFLFFASYTKRTTVHGQLIPVHGLVKIYTPQPGIIIKKHFSDGQRIRKGQVLYTLSSERQSHTLGGTQSSISQQARQRQGALREERDKTRQLQNNEFETLRHKAQSAQTELNALDEQISGQKKLVELAADMASRYQSLFKQDFISKDQWQQKQSELLEQRMKLQSLQRERTHVAQSLTALNSELAGLDLKQQNQLSEINRQLMSATQELAESEARRQIVITAPESGIAAAVIAEAGQLVDTTRALMSVVPENAQLRADLYAPSQAIGFIRAGDRVLLRYQAYPYQKFGQYPGRVLSVAQTALPASDLATITGSLPGAAAGDNSMYYRITVHLDQQTVNAYGKAQRLQTGMALQADILQDRRTLFEWVLEPLYSLSGGVKS